ncbi:hypothetical protein ACHAPT_002018 [Fusarium lateritium]
MEISWRGEICRLLGISPDVSDDKVFDAMGIASKKLKEIEQLRSRAKARQGPPRFQIIHSVRCENSRGEDKIYLDQPWVVESGPNDAHLRGSQPIHNFELYLERNKEIVFIVYKNYKCCERSRTARSRGRPETDIEVDASALLEREQISIISPALRSALVHLANTALRGMPHPDFGEDEDINYPYIWWFHRRREIDEAMDKLRPEEAWPDLVGVFRGYILDQMMDEWEAVDRLLEKSNISAQYMNYLFAHYFQVPEHIVISKKQGNALAKLQGFVAQDWLKPRTSDTGFSASIGVSSWQFDGRFRKTLEKLTINELPSETDEFDITDLPLYPIEFASDAVVEALRKRGRMFWECRFRNYVEYTTEEDDGIQNSLESDNRFSVAEIAKKPLYRVTCGDIGTKAEVVEEYLQVVLHLGKTWGCDEADVFLEQRSLVNLERNALVSVFLRVLEYYEGILILTSNRVGIFDEAFKSRIQLNLHYKNLDQDQRRQIWNNFLLRLKRLEEERVATGSKDPEGFDYGVNSAEIMRNVEKLADVNLNGRQIRNAISTARHLARYLEEPMAYKHFEVVINEAKKFDEYLLEVNKWFSADDIQRDKRER